jgi:hypothetical protein
VAWLHLAAMLRCWPPRPTPWTCMPPRFPHLLLQYRHLLPQPVLACLHRLPAPARQSETILDATRYYLACLQSASNSSDQQSALKPPDTWTGLDAAGSRRHLCAPSTHARTHASTQARRHASMHARKASTQEARTWTAASRRDTCSMRTSASDLFSSTCSPDSTNHAPVSFRVTLRGCSLYSGWMCADGRQTWRRRSQTTSSASSTCASRSSISLCHFIRKSEISSSLSSPSGLRAYL